MNRPAGALAREAQVTLVFSVRDQAHNDAVALRGSAIAAGDHPEING